VVFERCISLRCRCQLISLDEEFLPISTSMDQKMIAKIVVA
jgi:hypothetical protein